MNLGHLHLDVFLCSSLSRKFRASDGREYRWQHKTIDDHEWSVRPTPFLPHHAMIHVSSPFLLQCLSEENYIIAHYDLRPPNVPAYGVSGNNLTIYEAYSHLCMGTSALSRPSSNVFRVVTETNGRRYICVVDDHASHRRACALTTRSREKTVTLRH